MPVPTLKEITIQEILSKSIDNIDYHNSNIPNDVIEAINKTKIEKMSAQQIINEVIANPILGMFVLKTEILLNKFFKTNHVFFNSRCDKSQKTEKTEINYLYDFLSICSKEVWLEAKKMKISNKLSEAKQKLLDKKFDLIISEKELKIEETTSISP